MCPLAVYNDSGHDEGIYTTDNDTIESIIRDACPTIVQRDVNETKAFLRAMAPVKFRSNDRNLIALNNGVFDYETKMLLGFDPEWVFASKIGTDYNENAKNVSIHNDEDGTDWDSRFRGLRSFPTSPKPRSCCGRLSVRRFARTRHGTRRRSLYSTKGNNGKGTLCEAYPRRCREAQLLLPLACTPSGREFHADAASEGERHHHGREQRRRVPGAYGQPEGNHHRATL